MEAIAKADRDHDTVFVLKDFHACLERQPVIIRQLRNLAQELKYTHKTIIVISPIAKAPDELRDDVFLVEFPPPELEEMKQILELFTKNPQIHVKLTALGQKKVLRSTLGLSSNQAQRVFAKSIVAEGRGKTIPPAISSAGSGTKAAAASATSGTTTSGFESPEICSFTP